MAFKKRYGAVQNQSVPTPLNLNRILIDLTRLSKYGMVSTLSIKSMHYVDGIGARANSAKPSLLSTSKIGLPLSYHTRRSPTQTLLVAMRSP